MQQKDDFVTVSTREYEAITRLKKAGAIHLIVRFMGSCDDGCYKHIEVYPKLKKTYKQMYNDLQTIDSYLCRMLNKDVRISFNNEGCRGRIWIDLSKPEPVLELHINTPVSKQEAKEKFTINPQIEIEGLITEIENI